MYIDMMQQGDDQQQQDHGGSEGWQATAVSALDKLIQSTGQPMSDAMPAGSTEQAAAPAAPVTDAAGLPRGVRDALRSRDRRHVNEIISKLFGRHNCCACFDNLSMFVVDQRQTAIVLQLGELVGVKTEPGLCWESPRWCRTCVILIRAF
jgi:hypothetical protein